MNIKKMLVLAVLVLAAPSLAFAGHCGSACSKGDKSCSKYCDKSYTESVKYKLEYGVKNALTGWTEIFRGPQENKCPLTGLFQGIYDATAYTLGGVVNLATLPLPGKVKVANGGVQHD